MRKEVKSVEEALEVLKTLNTQGKGEKKWLP